MLQAVSDPQSPGTTNNLYGTNRDITGTLSGSAVRNVTIAGSGSPVSQRGVWIAGGTGGPTQDPSGRIEMTDTVIANMTNVGFLIGGNSGASAVTGGAADIDFSGSLTSDFSFNGGVENLILSIENQERWHGKYGIPWCSGRYFYSKSNP